MFLESLFSILAVSSALFTVWIVRLLGIDSFSTLWEVVQDATSGKNPVLQSLFRVDERSNRNGGELVASVLKAHRVAEVFTLCGGHISPILVACEQLGIRVVDTRHEATAVFAADAAARLRQSIGVAAVTAGPGITNTITAVKNAQLAESPVLLIGGAAPTLLRGRGALQDIEQIGLLRPLCKYATRVTFLRNIVGELRKAIQIAQSGTPGPVFVELPIDVLFPYQLVRKEMGISANPANLTKRLMNAYLCTHLYRQFGAAWIERDLSALKVHVPEPKQSDISRVVEILSRAKRPLLIIGSQAMLPPVKPDGLAETVKRLGIPTYLGGMSRGLLGRRCEIQMRQNRKEALRDADVTILAGSVCDFRLSYGKALSTKSKIIAINRCREQLIKNHSVFWTADVLIEADVGSTLVEIERRMAEKKEWSGAPAEWTNLLREREDRKEAENAEKMSEIRAPDGSLNPLAVLAKLEEVMPENAILVADGGDFVGSAAYILRPRGPLKWLDPGAFGTLGVGGGFAIGAKIVHPECPVVILYGDGASGYSLIEFDTLKRHQLPAVALIGNDACWSQIARDQVPWFNSAVGCELAVECLLPLCIRVHGSTGASFQFTNYHIIGEGLGASGMLLPKGSSETEVRRTLAQAFEAEKGGNCVVVNAIIGKTDFRKGSISV